ncbi:MAG: hypothetical protein K2X80_07885 [Pseudomonadaceae bacterium]|nr:hypothetical protein [Pseudomonadaceae bacterium]
MTVIKKSHGPSRDIPRVPLGRCEVCQGIGFIKGIFHRMECAACNGSGLINRDTCEALEPAAMVVQLRQRLNWATRQVEVLRAQLEQAGLAGGPAQDYVGMNNRRGNGGGNWTGD